MTQQEKKLKDDAEYAIKKLTQYRRDYKQGKIGHDVLRLVAKAHIDAYDRYASMKAKKHGLVFKKFSLMGFLR